MKESKLVKIDSNEYALEKLTKGVFSLTSKLPTQRSASHAQSIFLARIEGVEDVVSSTDQILLLSKLSYQELEQRLNSSILKQQPSRSWKLPIWFSDLEDWKRVEEISSVSKQDYISSYLKAKLEVSMLGFLPGFIYLNGMPKMLQIPRKENPSINRLSNVLAVGGPYAGIYSLPSPAGWNILGQIPIDILQLKNKVPMPFNIGDEVKFVQISKTEFNRIKENQLSLTEYNDA